MIKITTNVKIHKNEGGEGHFIFLSTPPELALAQEVEVYYDRKKLGQGFVAKIETKRLMDLTEADRAPFGGRMVQKNLFWAQIERAYGGGLPGEFSITLLTLSESLGEEVEEETPMETIPEEEGPSLPIKAKAYEDTHVYTATLEDFLG